MTPQDYADRTFLALTLWREARGEKPETIAGIAQVILNRKNHPSWWGNDVQSVVFKKWQFSSLTDPHDPQLTNWPLCGDASWQVCLNAACAALDGTAPNQVGGADSYYDISVPAPAWATQERFVVQLERIRFYQTAPASRGPA